MGKVRFAALASLAMMLAAIGFAHAAPQVEILTPSAGQCVNNGAAVYEEGGIGGRAQPPKSNFEATVLVTPGQAGPVTVRLDVGTPVERPALAPPSACTENAQCAQNNEGTCLFGEQCGCFVAADCQGGAPCLNGQCGCGSDDDCGPNEQCNPDGLCGCANDNACGAGQTCRPSGVCSCGDSSDCQAGASCVAGLCQALENRETITETFESAGTAFEATLSMSGEPILDAELKVAQVTVTNAGGQSSSDVRFKLDREVPYVDLSEPLMDHISVCRASRPNLNNLPLVLEDDLDPNPSVVNVAEGGEGCQLDQYILVTDNCGNQQRVTLTTRRAPQANEVSAVLSAYGCTIEGCAPDQDLLLSNGAVALRASAFYDITSAPGCYDEVSLSYQVSANPGDFSNAPQRLLIQGTPLETVSAQMRGRNGPYTLPDGAQLVLSVDGGPAQTVTFSAQNLPNLQAVTTMEAIQVILTQTEGLLADIDLGLMLRSKKRGEASQIQIVGGDAAGILGFTPGAIAMGSGDGHYQVSLRVNACDNANPLVDEKVHFTIIDRITADAGGPYEATQGEPLILSAAGSFAPMEAGGIEEYAWDLDGDGIYEIFGDETTAMEVPFDTLTNNDGLYRVNLRVKSGDGTIELAHAFVELKDVDPTCHIADTTPLTAAKGEPVTFDARGSQPGHPSEPITTYDWDFGDGFFPQQGPGLSQATHSFPDQGTFLVRLRVYDRDSFAQCTREIAITDVGPVVRGVRALNAENLFEGTPVSFTAGQTAPGSGDDPLINFLWTFGDGNQTSGLDRSPQHIYAQDGTYEVCLTVSDTDSSAPPFCFNIVVQDLTPYADFTGPEFVAKGQNVIFDASNTTAGGASEPLTKLEWNFGDGSPTVTINNPNDPSARRVNHTFTRSGNYDVSLTAYDTDSNTVKVRTVQVFGSVPNARLRVNYADGEGVGLEGVPLELDASNSTPGVPTDELVRYRWDFGDGTGMETAEPTISHEWPNEGEYFARVTVFDNDNGEATASVMVRIDNVPPKNLRIQGPTTIEIGETGRWSVEYDDVAADHPPQHIEWRLNGEQESNNLQYSPTFGSLGSYLMSVRITDSAGAEATATLEVQVTPAAPIISPVEAQVAYEGVPFSFTVDVIPALRNESGERDGPVRISISRLPLGANYSEAAATINGIEGTRVHFSWTPSYFDAGQTSIRLTAEGRHNETVRHLDIPIEVLERGSPYLAAVSGTAQRGQVTLYEYARQAGAITFTPNSRIDVGIGAGGVTTDQEGRFLFVASPGSAGVAVVDVASQRKVRTIPTGQGTRAVIRGGQHIWALDHQVGNLYAIDPVTLKVRATARLAVNEALDLAWVDASLNNAARIVIVTNRGEVALVDPQAILDGASTVLSRGSLGGRLNRVVVDPTTHDVLISDVAQRKLHRVALSALESSPQNLRPSSVDLIFAAKDLLAAHDLVYAATDAGLAIIDGNLRDNVARVRALALSDLPLGILSGGQLVVASEDRIENLDMDLTRIIDAAGSQIRRMTAFIALD